MDNRDFTREDVSFDGDGSTIRGWAYRPRRLDEKRIPLIVLASGYACVKEMHMDKYAAEFARAGMAAVAFDFRNLGASGGEPRQELNPWQQIEDYRHAITYGSGLPFADAQRIGIWGTSYSGGHVLVTAATDRRVKCVVAQTPTISGHWSGQRRVPMDKVPELTKALADDRSRRMKGEPPSMRRIVGEVSEQPVYPQEETREWFLRSSKCAPNWRNEVTLRSVEFARAYEPGIYVPFISPTPLLMIVGRSDSITGVDLELEAFNKALEPKKLVLLEGGHFSCYDEEFETASKAAIDWFTAHLLK
ncbi:MAG: alpha/beta hydrolase [Bryobacterales bacterium]|nr:alpha/beta hydrolase [Bryobacterales bacterium]